MDPIAGPVGVRTLASILGALPWPLNHLAADRLETVKKAIEPNRYAGPPSSSQAVIASYQAQRTALIGGMDGLAGSSRDWDSDQGRVSLAASGLGQDLSSQAIPPSRLLPYTQQGHPRDPNTTRGYTGPVITPGKLAWGWSARFAFPRIIAGTMLPPEARTPSARDMARAYTEANPSRLRVDDPYLVPDDSEVW